MDHVTQVLLSLAAAVLSSAALSGWRWIRRTSRKLIAVADTIEQFGQQWAEAAALDRVIRDNDEDLEELKRQLGTAGRDPGWASVEAFLHQWRHEQKNEAAALKVTIELLERIARAIHDVSGDMRVITEQLAARP